VGELVLHVFGVATPERIARSNEVCSALQLAEHWQDVAEDYRAGRVYLPADDLARFGVGAEELAAPHAGEELSWLMAFEVERARGLLDRGAALLATLDGYARLAVAGYVGGGRAALEAIELAGYDVLAGPPRAGKGARLRHAVAAYRRRA
jgi:phytoene/squalene synthetase